MERISRPRFRFDLVGSLGKGKSSKVGRYRWGTNNSESCWKLQILFECIEIFIWDEATVLLLRGEAIHIIIVTSILCELRFIKITLIIIPSSMEFKVHSK